MKKGKIEGKNWWKNRTMLNQFQEIQQNAMIINAPSAWPELHIIPDGDPNNLQKINKKWFFPLIFISISYDDGMITWISGINLIGIPSNWWIDIFCSLKHFQTGAVIHEKPVLIAHPPKNHLQFTANVFIYSHSLRTSTGERERQTNILIQDTRHDDTLSIPFHCRHTN